MARYAECHPSLVRMNDLSDNHLTHLKMVILLELFNKNEL